MYQALLLVMCINSFNPHKALSGGHYYCPHFMGEETEA